MQERDWRGMRGQEMRDYGEGRLSPRDRRPRDYGYGYENRPPYFYDSMSGYGMGGMTSPSERGNLARMAGQGGGSTGVGYGPGGEFYGAGHHGGPGEGRFEPWGESPDWPRQQGGRLESERDFARGRTWEMSRSSPEDERRSFRGRGPQNYRRSDERIREDVCDRLTEDQDIDASNIQVLVDNGEVTLEGQVDERRVKWMAEEVASRCLGVADVHNHLRVVRPEPRGFISGGQEEQVTGRNGGGRATAPMQGSAPRASR
jgi:hypothetical protein